MASQEALEIVAALGSEKVADLLELLGSTVIKVSDALEDEGDRVYLGSTNHKDALQDAVNEWFEARYLICGDDAA